MHESLEIKNFGPITHLRIDDVKPFIVLIGPSGSGKSTVLKVLALFRWLAKMINIRSFLKLSGISKAPFRIRFDSLLRSNGLDRYRKPDTEITYTFGSSTIKLTSKLDGTAQIVPEDELSLEKMSFVSDKRNILPSVQAGDVKLVNSFYAEETYSDYQQAVAAIPELEIPYLGVRFVTRRTSSGVKHLIENLPDSPGAYSINLKDASSGTQNVVPVHLIVKYFTQKYDLVDALNRSILHYLSKSDSLTSFKAVTDLGKIAHKRVTLFVEEPELSLFPESQVDMLNFMVSSMASTSGYDMEMVMATHSPYLVAHLNVLLTASSMPMLRADQLAVYRMDYGEMRDIMLRDDTGRPVAVDTSDLSETMSDIADAYIHNLDHPRS